MKKYKAILFDMDGVIADSMHWHAECWQRAFSDYGIDLPKEEIFKREGMSGLDSIMDIIKEKDGMILEKQDILRLQKNKLSIFETKKIEVFPFVRGILLFIRKKNIKTGLVTGSLRRSVEYILGEDFLNFFDVIITVDDINNGKPHPEPYLKAMEMLGSRPGETLVIENAPMGIASAVRAGADCFAVETTLDSTYLSEAGKIFSRHESLYLFLKDNL